MTKYQRKKSRRERIKTALPMFLIGIGLITLSIVGFLMWPGTNQSEAETQAPATRSEGPSSIPISVEYPAPALTIIDLEGRPVSLQDYLGKVILVNNWATWCPPCKAEMPALQEYYEAHKDQGFMIVAIEAGDEPSSIKQFVDEYSLTFDVLADPNMLALAVFRNDGLPNSYVIDREGVVRLAWTGAISLSMLETHLTPLLEN